MPAEFNTHEHREIAHVHAGANLWNIAEQELRHMGKNPRDAKAVNAEVHHLAQLNHITDGKLTIHQGQLLKLYETCFHAQGDKEADAPKADKLVALEGNGNSPLQQISFGKRLPDEEQDQQKKQLQPQEVISAKLPDVKPGYEQVAPGSHPFTADAIAKTQSFAVDQAGYGDCWFESSLAGLARDPRGPAAIASMITTAQDGYVVTFPGDAAHPIHVNENEIANDRLADKAKWAQVVEAALIKQDPKDAQNCGQIAVAIKLLTGRDSTVFATSSVSQLDLGHQISEALSTGGVVGADTPNSNPPSAGRADVASKKSALLDGHAYSVLSYDASGPDGGTVIVRNPWGNNGGTAVGAEGTTSDGITNIGDGNLEMSLAKFQKKFARVTLQHTDTSLLAKIQNLGWSVAEKSGALSVFDNIPDAFAFIRGVA